MVHQNKVIHEILNDIANENNIINPKITISDAFRGGHLGNPNKITIEDALNGKKKNNKALHLFLKSAPTEEKTREVISLGNIYLNEIYMYTEVLPTFLKFQEDKGVKEPFRSYAKCYKCSKEELNEFLIFEDLVKSDYVLWDISKPISAKNVEFVLKQTAKYHAISFAIQDQNPDLYRELTKMLYARVFADLMNLAAFEKTSRLNYEQALKCFDPVNDENTYNKFKYFIDNEAKAVNSQLANEDEVVIIHGDSWCNNFMFKFENSGSEKIAKEMAFLDWQCSRSASPVVDLCYFLYCNGPQEVLDNLDFYHRVYHDTLSAALKEMGTNVDKVFPLSSLKNHWKKYAKSGLVLACGLLIVSCDPNHSEVEDLGTMIEDKEKFTESFSEGNLENNVEYRSRMRGIISHFVDNGFI